MSETDGHSPDKNGRRGSLLQRLRYGRGIPTILAQFFAKEINQQLTKTIAAEVHRNLAHVDQHMAKTITAEVHRNLAHVDQHMTETSTRNHIDILHEFLNLPLIVREHRFLQNRSYGRDNLPSAVAVKQYYLQLKAFKEPLDFNEIGVSVFSQNNEDGILLYIFAHIGMLLKRCIEVGCDLSGSTVGIPEGNSINLITNFGFDGLIIDIDPDKIGSIRHFFAQALTTKHLHAPAQDGIPAHYFSPTLVTQEIRADNINSVFEEAGFTGEIDLLSIDVDGADVLIWKAVSIVNPRVVMVEINARLPFDKPIYGKATTSTAPLDSLEYQRSGGSSLSAACEVGAEKGYVFIGMDATLLNAFFVRRDIWQPFFPERRPEEYIQHHMNPMRR